jgi:hypothetical protein
MDSIDSDRQELERSAQILAEQADHLIQKLGVDVSDVKPELRYSHAFQQAAYAYERLNSARGKAKPEAWENTMIIGRNGDELMSRLWPVREELKRRDSANT